MIGCNLCNATPEVFLRPAACRLSALSLHALGRPGNDLLSHALRRSTIGAEGLYGRVRNGIGCYSLAIATRSSKHMDETPKPAAGVALQFLTAGPLGGPVKPYNFAVHRRHSSTVLAAVRGDRLSPSEPEGPDGRPAIKPIEQLVLVSSMRYRTSTSSLSTWWSSTALKRDLVSRWASRLDAFSGYPFRT